MKILLIHTGEENEAAGCIESLLVKLDILFDAFILNSPQDIDINRFTGFFDFSGSEDNENQVIAPSHVLVASPLDSQWFDFLAGFAFGSRVHILIYRQEAIPGISKEFAAFFTFLALLIIENSQSHSDTPHSVGLPWKSDQLDAETST